MTIEAQASFVTEVQKLSENERKTLMAWKGTCEENNVLPFAAVARKSDINPGLVRRFVRALARKRMLQFCRMSWNDEGPRGAGYTPTPQGYAVIALAEAEAG